MLATWIALGLNPVDRQQRRATSPPGAHILDGESVVQDEIGRSDFNRPHARALRRCWHAGAGPILYCVFDLLVHGGCNIRALPIEERKARLRALLTGVENGLLFVDCVQDGGWLWQAVVGLKLEGVVAKAVGSAYVAGESGAWLKIKRPGAIAPLRFHRAI